MEIATLIAELDDKIGRMTKVRDLLSGIDGVRPKRKYKRRAVVAKSGRNHMSAAARRRLSIAMKERWASGKMGKMKRK